jgi:hypothetical protein
MQPKNNKSQFISIHLTTGDHTFGELKTRASHTKEIKTRANGAKALSV